MPLGSLPSPDGMFHSENKTSKSCALHALSDFSTCRQGPFFEEKLNAFLPSAYLYIILLCDMYRCLKSKMSIY